MAYTPCATSQLQACIVKDCLHPAFEGLEELGIIFPKSGTTTIVRATSSSEKNNIVSITPSSESSDIKVITASGETAFAGTTEEFDASTKRWTKTVTIIVPAHGSAFSAKVIEAMTANRDGFVIVLQRKDTNNDCAFPVIGSERGAVLTAATLDYNDSATGGCYTLTFTESGAPSAEIDLFNTDYAKTKGAFDALVAGASC